MKYFFLSVGKAVSALCQASLKAKDEIFLLNFFYCGYSQANWADRLSARNDPQQDLNFLYLFFDTYSWNRKMNVNLTNSALFL
jgi:hypothetical protein